MQRPCRNRFCGRAFYLCVSAKGSPFRGAGAKRLRGCGRQLHKANTQCEFVCIAKFHCRGRCPHRPGGLHWFYENLRRIRNFPTGRQSRRPLQRGSNLQYPVGADDSVRPQNAPILRKSSADSQLPQGPMWVSAPTDRSRGSLGARKGAPRSVHLLNIIHIIQRLERLDDLAVLFILLELRAVDRKRDGKDAEAGI